jgi:putative aldouronate transport system substrate-binding protein
LHQPESFSAGVKWGGFSGKRVHKVGRRCDAPHRFVGQRFDNDVGLAAVVLDSAHPTKVINWYKSDYYKKLVTLTHKWYTEGLIYKDAAINQEMPEELIKANSVLGEMTGSEIGVEASKTAQIGYPIVAQKMATGLITTTALRKFVWVTPAYSKKADAAVKFLTLMYTNADITNLLDWGIEGRDYVAKSDGTIDYPSGVTANTCPYHGMDFLYGNQYLAKVWAGNPPDLRAQSKAENQAATPSPLLGFSYDTTPVQNELAAIQNLLKQYQPGLESGTVDPDKELPKFLAAVDEAGGEKVIAEIQKQLDAWYAKK